MFRMVHNIVVLYNFFINHPPLAENGTHKGGWLIDLQNILKNVCQNPQGLDMCTICWVLEVELNVVINWPWFGTRDLLSCFNIHSWNFCLANVSMCTWHGLSVLGQDHIWRSNALACILCPPHISDNLWMMFMHQK